MPVVTVEINARQDTVGQPVIWRLGKLFNVVTTILRARVTEDYGYVALDLEGSAQEVAQASSYLQSLGLSQGNGAAATVPTDAPEIDIPQPNSIYMRLSIVNAAQGRVPFLYRVGKDLDVVVNIERAEFDNEEGGFLEVTISGPLMEVQRAIAYFHTTGMHVNPRQRSVTDYGNL